LAEAEDKSLFLGGHMKQAFRAKRHAIGFHLRQVPVWPTKTLIVDPVDYRRSSSKILEYERNLFVEDSAYLEGFVALPKQFIINEHIGALDISNRISGLFGSFGSGVCRISRVVGDEDGKAQSEGLENTNADQETVEDQGPPIFRRLILAISAAIASVFGGFCISMISGTAGVPRSFSAAG
jgi:hypothetical protein